jgi:2'-5' RNA ligase
MRLFIALDTPAGVRADLRELKTCLESSHADVRWEPPDKYHCTLLFIGDVNDSAVEDVADQITESVGQHPRFDVRYTGVGFFPTPERARVVWAGVHDDGSCAGLHERLRIRLRQFLGREQDPRFHAHITLGRVRSPRNLSRLITIAESCTFDHPPVTVREIKIIKSDLRPAGSVYTVVRSIPFLE